MNAKEKIVRKLYKLYKREDVDAMTVFKGFAPDTGKTGWHFRFSGRSNHTFLGKSAKEAIEFIENIVHIPW